MNFIRKILDTHSKENKEFFQNLKRILGFSPLNLSFYKKAFIHRSTKRTDVESGFPINYERLEFLGDAMLGSVIASYLFLKVPNGDEGYLTQMRSKIVSREHLNEVGTELQLLQFVESGVAKSKFGDDVNGNILESLIGAIFLDRGYKYCEKFIYRRIILPYADVAKLEGKITSYKSLFIEWCQKEKHEFLYEIYEDTGNDPVKHFSVKLFLNKEILSKGRATSKKKAEEIASKRAYFAKQHQII